MKTNSPDPIEILTAPNPRASIIWLHGLGADGHDFSPMAETLRLPVPVRYVFPHAPVRRVTINGGYAMRAWYDVLSPDITQVQDEAGIRASQALLNTLIEREKQRGIECLHIFLAGFSQGGAIVLHAGLRYPERLGGIIALSTYLPLQETLKHERSDASTQTPIFMGHGRQDSVVSLSAASKSRDLLNTLRQPVHWHEYDMPHTVCIAEIDDIRNFIADRLHDA